MVIDKHTEIDLRITPVGQDSYVETHLFKDNVMNAEEADDYLGWGNIGNDIIKDAVYFSQYGRLDNYEVIRCDVFTSVELLERKIIRLDKSIKENEDYLKKNGIVIPEPIITVVEETLTEEERVSIASANGIKWALDNSNRLANKKKISIEEQWKDIGTNGFIKPNGEFVEAVWHIDYANQYLYENDLDERYHDIIEKDRPMGIQSPTEFLEHMGWVRIQGDRDDTQNYIENAHFKTINNTQLKVLNLMCLKYNKKFEDLVYSSEWMWELSRKNK